MKEEQQGIDTIWSLFTLWCLIPVHPTEPLSYDKHCIEVTLYTLATVTYFPSDYAAIFY